ncbi:MAG: DUF6282 family protein [bacterium]|nr:DUF6282 family protein [bacterium]
MARVGEGDRQTALLGEYAQCQLAHPRYAILEGAIDLHLHPGPTVSPRSVDFFDAAADAARIGMRALVYKPLYFATMDAAYAARKATPTVDVFGGVTLDQVAGGLSPTTVQLAIQAGAKFVWMPLFDSAHTRAKTAEVPFYKDRVFGSACLSIFNADGRILDEVVQIVDLVAAAPGVVLATSHLSPRESLALVQLAKERRVEQVIVTHPTADIIGATLAEQKELARLGALLEHSWGYTQPKATGAGQNPVKIAEAIQAVGPKHCVMSSDMGIWSSPPPVEGLRCFAEIMIRLGITEAGIDMMLKRNPARVLGLS